MAVGKHIGGFEVALGDLELILAGERFALDRRGDAQLVQSDLANGRASSESHADA
ncbi:MAG: hypothetical protein KGY81_03215 [Phycisphaerae bacterium]|nr:hypothetical protein [Phycisphaerae bacterium]